MKNIHKLLIKITALTLISSFGVMTVSAGYLSSIVDTMSSAKVSTVSNHDFSFVTPTGVASGETIIITFPSNFSIPAALSYADVNVLDGSTPVDLAAEPSGATAGVATTSSTVLTFTNGTGAIEAGHTIHIKIGTNAGGTYQITNASTPGNKTIGITGSFTDVGTSTVDIVTNDAVAINALVNQSLTFAISSNAINFGALTTSNAKFATADPNGNTSATVAHTLTMATNSTAGYTITVQGSTLTSQQNPSNTITAIGATPASSDPGTSEQFGIRSSVAGGSGATIDPTYIGDSTYGYDGTAETPATFATGNVATNTTTYSLYYVANINSVTEAGNYGTALTYVGTANF